MSDDLSHTQSMIIVFAMAGCPACEEYKPRFEKMVAGFQRHGVPIVYHVHGRAIARGTIPLLIVDAASENPSVVSLADQYGVSGLPSTLLLTRRGRPVRLEGAVDDQQIYDLLAAASQANR